MSKVVELLRDKACYYLDHTCETIDKSLIHVPSPDTIDKIWIDSDRSIRVLNSLQTLLGHGRLAGINVLKCTPFRSIRAKDCDKSSRMTPLLRKSGCVQAPEI